MKIIILAGGSGTRFWPMSRNNKPKQLCRLVSNRTMLEETIDRFKSWPEGKIYISTTKELLPLIKENIPNFPQENYIIEPALRDTASAMGYVAAKMELEDPNEPIAFVPADHQIGNVKKFLQSIQEAEKVILETGKLLDISVTPVTPTTTLGYTKVGKIIREENGIEFYEFLGHKEKPEFETAKKYLEDGAYLWHASYYMWTPKKFLEAYKKYVPETHSILMGIQKVLQEKGSDEKIDALYEKLEKISIDYAITEKMNPEEILIIKGDFGWDDIGAWDTLYQNLSAKIDEKGNLIKGENLAIDTSGCFIFGKKNKIIATIGLEGLVIVDTEDALLICPQSRSQEVKQIVEKLKKDGKNSYL